MELDHETRLFDALLCLADTLTSGVNVVDLAGQLIDCCLELTNFTAAGILLDDHRGTLRVLASSSEETRALELLELQNRQGPCLDAFTSGIRVDAPDLVVARDRWPEFVAAAEAQGFRSAYAMPMRLRDRTIGALNLFSTQGQLSESDLRIAELLARMATIGIHNHRTIREQERLTDQLQTALNSRVVIEQAKGVVAQRAGISLGDAFEVLRQTARSSQRQLSEVAHDVANGHVSPEVLIQQFRARRR